LDSKPGGEGDKEGARMKKNGGVWSAIKDSRDEIVLKPMQARRKKKAKKKM